MRTIMDVMFGCWHRNLSFPITREGRTYQVCLECGRELEYSWEEMRVVKNEVEAA